MLKHTKKNQWLNWFELFEYSENYYHFFKEYANTCNKPYKTSKQKRNTRYGFRKKFAKWFENKDNYFMENIETRGRKSKRREEELNKIREDTIKGLTEYEKTRLIEELLKERDDLSDDDKDKLIEKHKYMSKTKIAGIFKYHRTTLYKKRKIRKYKLDSLKNIIVEGFDDNDEVFGRKRLSKKNTE